MNSLYVTSFWLLRKPFLQEFLFTKFAYVLQHLVTWMLDLARNTQLCLKQCSFACTLSVSWLVYPGYLLKQIHVAVDKPSDKCQDVVADSVCHA